MSRTAKIWVACTLLCLIWLGTIFAWWGHYNYWWWTAKVNFNLHLEGITQAVNHYHNGWDERGNWPDGSVLRNDSTIVYKRSWMESDVRIDVFETQTGGLLIEFVLLPDGDMIIRAGADK